MQEIMKKAALLVVIVTLPLAALTSTSAVSQSTTTSAPTVKTLEGSWQVTRVVSEFQTRERNPRETVGKTLIVKNGRISNDARCRWDQQVTTDAELSSDAATRARFSEQKIVSQGQGIYEFMWLCGNALGASVIVIPGPSTTMLLRTRDAVFELRAATTAGAPASAAAPLKDLGQLSGLWVPVGAFPQGCAPSPAWIAASDQAMKIDAKTIERYEWDCAVTAVAPAPGNGLRVNARCGYAGTVENVTINMSLADGRLTVREKNATKTYAKCQR